MLKKFNLGYSRIASSFTSTTALTRRRSLTLSRSVEGLKMILLLVFCARCVYSIQNTQSFKIPFITSFKITMKCNTLRAYAIHTYSHNPFLYDDDQIITMWFYCERMYCQLFFLTCYLLLFYAYAVEDFYAALQ